MSTFPRGSEWRKWDLHIHTPGTAKNDNYTGHEDIWKAYIAKLESFTDIAVLGITDYLSIENYIKVKDIQSTGGLQGKLLVPNVELRILPVTSDDIPINLHVIFDPNVSVADIDREFFRKLNFLYDNATFSCTRNDLIALGRRYKRDQSLEETSAWKEGVGQFIVSHGEIGKILAGEFLQGKFIVAVSNKSTDGNSGIQESALRASRQEIYRMSDIIFSSNPKDVNYFLGQGCDPKSKVIADYGSLKPCIIGSDAHKFGDVCQFPGNRVTWIKADPTFRGLLMVLREPRERVYIGDRPPELVRVEQNRTKYIKSVSFQRRASAPPLEQWFSGSVEFNPGLVAIVGNKGSGKSALSDMLGLLGATKNSASFSFLNEKRFRYPSSPLAEHFDATVEWESNDSSTKCLADTIQPEEVERIKYLPQDHVEKVCNELANLGERGFELELKAVIFSHIPEAQRLGHSSLDDVVNFQTGEKQKRIDSLLKQLRELSRSRVLLEAQADPTVRKELTEKINRRKLELEAHDKAKPEAVSNPAADGSAPAPDATFIDGLKTTEESRKSLSADIAKQAESLRATERRSAVAKRLIEKMENFVKEFDVFKASLTEDAAELGLAPEELVSLAITRGKPESIRDSATTAAKAAKDALDKSDPPGLRKQLEAVEARIAEIQTRLDAPNLAYQAYLKTLSEWETKRTAIEGTATDAESLKGLEHRLSALDGLPSKIAAMKDQQTGLSLQIHAEKIAQAAVYRDLYGAVQGFIDSHVLAEKLKLEFRAELTSEDFSGRLLSGLALNRKGSFMGVDEGRAKAESFVQATNWEDTASVKTFLVGIDEALHTDQREGQGGAVQLKDQLAKGRKPEEVFDTLYGMEYIRPRYILRWDGKDLSMLSPGERGTLLLVFYLLIDKSDLPLVIDQPEGNLDNHTVAKVLVECIKDARKRRQVFIVTHNPNLAVVCDADQIVHAEMDKANNNVIKYKTGSLENPDMQQNVTDVLEGTLWAFRIRDQKYSVGDNITRCESFSERV